MTEQKYTTILVPVDGSKAAKLAFDRGVEIAKRNHSHLDVLNVIDLNQFTVSFAGMVLPEALSPKNSSKITVPI